MPARTHALCTSYNVRKVSLLNFVLSLFAGVSRPTLLPQWSNGTLLTRRGMIRVTKIVGVHRFEVYADKCGDQKIAGDHMETVLRQLIQLFSGLVPLLTLFVIVFPTNLLRSFESCRVAPRIQVKNKQKQSTTFIKGYFNNTVSLNLV